MSISASRRAARSLPVAALLFWGPGFAAAGSGAEGAAFLDIPAGARPAALGGAYSALAADGFAPIWNPAGLGAIEAKRLALTHLDHLAANYEFAGYAHPLRANHGLGVAAQYYRPGSFTATDALGNHIGDANAHYGAYSLAYGAGVSEWLSVGVAGKVVRAQIDGIAATAYAADVGALYRPRRELSLAAVAANLGTQLKFMEQGDDLPRTFRVGGAYHLGDRWSFLLEGLYAATGLGGARAGAEWRPLELVALRLGYKSDTVRELSPLAGLSTGVGVLYQGHEFSYAWVPHGELGFTQQFSLAFRFGGLETPDAHAWQR